MSYFFHHIVEVIKHLTCQPIFELPVSAHPFLLQHGHHQTLEILFVLNRNEGLGGLTEEPELTLAHLLLYIKFKFISLIHLKSPAFYLKIHINFLFLARVTFFYFQPFIIIYITFSLSII